MSKRGKKKLRYQSRTPISAHKKQGKVLKPPFVQFGVGKGLVSWTNDRLPEMIWAALLISGLGRDRALQLFRTFLRFGSAGENERFWDVTLTGFSQLNESDRKQRLALLCQSEESRQALAPLLLFSALPARETWQEALRNPRAGPVELLMQAVRFTLFHQSQEATDCRWVRLMAAVFGRRVMLPREELLLLNGYPHQGDQTHVRPSIRACEISIDHLREKNLTWPNAFWAECWEKTPCFAARPEKETKESAAGEPAAYIPMQEVRRALESHWESTRDTTAIDARHDAVFGVAFYALRLIEEVLEGHDIVVSGRLTLRTLFELRLTLRYLLQEDKEELWQTWRKYGVGQAKLISLKSESFASVAPQYLDGDLLKQIANEDFWEEFVGIDLGHWAGSDLRKLSEKVELKDVYDRYYGWTSGFSHGQWGPIRESVFVLCLNPLHRGHRIPKTETPPRLSAVTGDAIDLFDSILSDVETAYPPFSIRCKTADSSKTHS